MTKYQKEQILSFRGNGESCAKIANNLGLSVNTVKSFCRRHNAAANNTANINMEMETGAEAEQINKTAAAIISNGDACPQCGNTITQIKGRKPKRFCCDKCRELWWNSHREDIRQKALYSFKCACCGNDFTAYGNSKRRYCSHTCYCKSRFGSVRISRTAENAIHGKAATV